MTTLRREIEDIARRLRPYLAPSETEVLRGDLIQLAIRVGQVERLADEMVSEAMAEAALPPPAPTVVRLADFRREAPHA